MRITIYLIRHAEAQSNIDPFHMGESNLTENGIDQAIRLAKRFADKRIKSIFTSEVLRAKQTAFEIVNVSGIIPEELDFLKERKGLYSKDGIFSPSESFNAMSVRLNEAKIFFENLSEGNYIVISHAIFMKAFLAYIMINVVDEKLISCIEESLVIDNATISKIIFNKEKRKWRIQSLNCSI